MMRKFIAILIFVLVFSLIGCLTAKNPKVVTVSDNESKRESVEELLNLTDADSMMDSVYSQMGQMFQGMGQQLGVKPEEQEMFDKFMSKMFSLMEEEMSWDKMKEPMIQIYLKHYSEKEIQDQIAFYKSESGQSMISKQPEVLKDTMMITQEALKKFIPKMQQLSKEFEKELTGSTLAADIDGKWEGEIVGQNMKIAFTFKAEGEKLTGTHIVNEQETTIEDGKIKGNNISFAVTLNMGQEMKIPHKGTITGDKIKMTYEMMGQSGEILVKKAK